ncbi:MAG: SRPBCC domain-containing protein [Actinomycetota bacterium]|nr:SRPBCC domain-containing protein [Actinomycetota bacterium]
MIDVQTGADRIVIRVEIGAPRDRVWQALTDEERIAQWWGDHVSFDARPGGCVTERWTDAGGREVVTSGEVVRLIAPRTLELTWADDDWDEPTRVLFRLDEAADDATRLTLEHSGWEAFPPSTREELVRTHASGWSDHMANLAAYSARPPR